jgi:hypothetical protein
VSRLKPEPPPECAACKMLPAAAGSVMCQGCKNHARRLVDAFLARGSEVLVRSPPGSGWP